MKKRPKSKRVSPKGPTMFKPLSLRGLPRDKRQFAADGFKGGRK